MLTADTTKLQASERASFQRLERTYGVVEYAAYMMVHTSTVARVAE